MAGRSRTIGEEFAQEKAQGLPLPAHGFDACVSRPAVVDKYQTVRVDRCRYSVPRECAFRPVTVKLYPERLQIVHAGKVVAEHKRLAEAGAPPLSDPLHYLPTLLHKPATLDHANVFTAWELPASFQQLRATFEQCHGPSTGAALHPGIATAPASSDPTGGAGPGSLPAARSSDCRDDRGKDAGPGANRWHTGGEAQPAMPPGIPVVTGPPPDLRRFDE